MLLRLAAVVITTILTTPLLAQDWLIDVEMSSSELTATAAARQTQGFMPTSLSARGSITDPTFAAVWRRNPTNAPWEIHFDLPLAGIASTANSVGYRMACLDAYGVGVTRYAAVFVDNASAFGPTTMVADIDPANFASAISSQQALGREPIWVGAGGAGTAARMCAVFSTSGDPVTLLHDYDSPTFATNLQGGPNAGFTFHSSGSWHDGTELRFSALGYSSSVLTETSHGVTAAELPALQRWLLARNLVPISIDAWDDGTGARFSVVHRETAGTSVWRDSGVAVPELAAIDQAMQSFMQTANVPTGLVAITRNGKLIFKRAYNYNATGIDTAVPDSDVRIASMSKVFTATAVMQLVDDGLLNLGQTIGTIPNLSLPGWTATSKQITVRQLLNHTSGLPNGGLIGNEENIAAAAGQSLPAEPWMWVTEMANNQPFSTPNTTQAYSNFGYSLLGRIVEAVTGERYEDYTAREVLGAVAAGRFRTGGSRLDEQGPTEIPYVENSDHYGISVFGDDARVPGVYGSFNMHMGDSVGSWTGSTESVARFLTAFDDPTNSPLLSLQAINLSWARPPIVPTGDYRGLGWQIKNGTGARWHGGVLAGLRSFMCHRTDGINFVAIVGKDDPGAVNGSDLYDTIDDTLDQITVWPNSSFDLWLTTPSFETYGEGCGGSNGVPGVRLKAGTLPKLGTQVGAELFSLPTGVPLALSAMSLSSVPLDLTFLGFAGCTLYPETPILDTLPAMNEVADWTFDLPNAPALVGTKLHLQGIGLDNSVPGMFIFSHGSALTLGN